jgi:hypothetical protein
MIVGYFDIERVAISKAKAYAPLIVDPDRMLASAIALQCFEPIGWRQAQIVYAGRRIQLPQPHRSAAQDIARQLPRFAGGEEALGFSVGKRSDHKPL